MWNHDSNETSSDYMCQWFDELGVPIMSLSRNPDEWTFEQIRNVLSCVSVEASRQMLDRMARQRGTNGNGSDPPSQAR